MRKALITVLTLFMIITLASSCNDKNKPELDIPDPTQTPNIIIDNDNPVIKIYNTSISEGTEKDTFEALVEKEFGIKIEVYEAKDKFSFLGASSLSNLDGLMFYDGNAIYSKGYTKDNFYPLNEFLESNEIFNLLPDILKESLKDENGTIWYIPLGHNFSLPRRNYMSKIMADNNYDVPTSLSELIDLLVDVESKYGSSEDFSVMYLNRRFCLRNLEDILGSYGIRIYNGGSSYSGVIGWNERNNRFEDTTVNVDLEEVLSTINHLVELEIIDTDQTFSMSYDRNWRAVEAEKLFTSFGNYKSLPNYSSGSLSGDSAEYIYNSTPYYLFMPLGVREPEYIFNTFINTFLSSNKGNIIGVYGESGRFVEYDDSYTYVRNLPSSEHILNPENNMVYWINLVGTWFGNNYVIYNSDSSNEEKEEEYIEKIEFYEHIKKGFDDGSLIALYPNKQINPMLGSSNIKQANNLFADMLYSFINGNIDIASFQEEYFATMKKLGVENYLNNENEKIPGASRFSYGD